MSGAAKARATTASTFAHWRAHHGREARAALARLLATPLASLMTLLVVALALALPATLSLLLDNARGLIGDWDGQARISLYLRQDLPAAGQQALQQRLAQRRDIERTRLITPGEALEEFRQLSGYGNVLGLLDDNPLPPVVVVWPADGRPAAVSGLRDALAAIPEVDSADIDMAWVQRLAALLAFGERLLLALGLALAATVLLVIGNTIRLGFESRRDEVRVLSLLGATDAFIRRPFLWTGFWTGFAGGLLALLATAAVMFWLGGPVAELAALYQSEFALTGPGLGLVFGLPAGSALLGLAGAWLAVARLLRAMAP